MCKDVVCVSCGNSNGTCGCFADSGDLNREAERMEQANERAASMIERPEAVAEEEDGDKGDTEGKKRHYEVIFSYYGAVGFEVTAEDEWDAREQAWELWQKMPSAEIGENVGDVWSVEAELLDDDGDGEEGDKEEGDQD